MTSISIYYLDPEGRAAHFEEPNMEEFGYTNTGNVFYCRCVLENKKNLIIHIPTDRLIEIRILKDEEVPERKVFVK